MNKSLIRRPQSFVILLEDIDVKSLVGRQRTMDIEYAMKADRQKENEHILVDLTEKEVKKKIPEETNNQ